MTCTLPRLLGDLRSLLVLWKVLVIETSVVLTCLVFLHFVENIYTVVSVCMLNVLAVLADMVKFSTIAAAIEIIYT
jgi:hypothetical protein